MTKQTEVKVDPRGKITMTGEIPLDEILFDPKFNARGNLDGEQTIAEMAQSIKVKGLVHPITVWEHKGVYKTKLRYVAIVGFRRGAAHQLLREQSKGKHYTAIRSQVWEGTERDALLLNLVENTSREDLKPWEIAKRAIELSERFEMTGTEIGHNIGRSKTYADNLMRALRNLPAPIVDEWKKGNPLATTNNLNLLSAKKSDDGEPDHDKMMAKWREWTGAPAEGEEGEGGESGEGEGEGNGSQAGKLKRPSKTRIAECLAAVKKAVKNEKRSADWGKGAREMLAFMTGQRDSIIGVYSPRVKEKSSPDIDAELED